MYNIFDRYVDYILNIYYNKDNQYVDMYYNKILHYNKHNFKLNEIKLYIDKYIIIKLNNFSYQLFNKNIIFKKDKLNFDNIKYYIYNTQSKNDSLEIRIKSKPIIKIKGLIIDEIIQDLKCIKKQDVIINEQNDEMDELKKWLID